MEKLNVLYVEDQMPDFVLLKTKLEGSKENFLRLTHAQTLKKALKLLADVKVDLVLLDLSLPDADGMIGLNLINKSHPDLPVVVLTGNTDKANGLKAIQNGAQDYVIKDEINAHYLNKVCNYAIERSKIKSDLKAALTDVETLNSELLAVNNQFEQTLIQLKKEKKLVEKKNRQINSFINVLVHDLKNPLNAITSLTSLLLQGAQQLNFKQLKFVEQIKHSSSSMLDNVLTIIETTQINTGNLRLSLIVDSPYYTINSAIDRFIMEAIQKNVIFDIRYQKNLPRVRFDKRSLDHVISNILAFSIRHTSGDSRIVFDVENTKESLQLLIHDKGLSLSEERKQELFGDSLMETDTGIPFVSEEEVMAGYNLSLAQQLASAMDGDIQLSQASSLKGTLFILTLQRPIDSIVGDMAMNAN